MALSLGGIDWITTCWNYKMLILIENIYTFFVLLCTGLHKCIFFFPILLSRESYLWNKLKYIFLNGRSQDAVSERTGEHIFIFLILFSDSAYWLRKISFPIWDSIIFTRDETASVTSPVPKWTRAWFLYQYSGSGSK